MAAVPGSVKQFLAVAVPVVLNFVVFLILAACLVINGGKNSRIVAPHKPKSKVGQAKGVCSWLSAVIGLSMKDVEDGGGLEAVLQVKRLQMRIRMCFVWMLLGAPIAAVYALNPLGGETELGFDRITFQNANHLHKNTGIHSNGDRWWKNLALVVGAYLLPLLALPIVDSYDEEATELMAEDAIRAPLEHYAVMITGLDDHARDETKLKNVFESALGAGSVLGVELVRDLSVKPDGIFDEAESSSVTSKLASSGPGGVRQRFAALAAAFKAAKRADLALEASKEATESKMPKVPTKSPEEVQGDAYSKVAKKQEALNRALALESKKTGAAIVMFASIAKATAAATAPLGLRHSWTVSPSPEPRDILWPILEKLPVSQGEIDQKASVGARIKTSLYVFWALILAGLVIAAQFILKIADQNLSGGLKTLIELISGLVPTLIASIMMSLVATILRAVNAATRFDCWSESKLQLQTQRDFVTFIQMIGFIVPLLGTSLFSGISEMGGRPLKIFSLIAGNVPVVAYYFAMLCLVKMAVFLNASTRFVPWIVFHVMNKLFCKTDFEREALFKAKPANFAPWTGWETFVFLVAAVYTPVAPYATAIAWIYLSLAVIALKLQVAVVDKTPFASHGASWRVGVQQTVTVVFLANALHIGILLFSNNLIHFVCTLPVLAIDSFFAAKFDHRYKTKNVHGKAKGRLPLVEASNLDKTRPDHLIQQAADAVQSNKLFSPQQAVNLASPYLFDTLAQGEDITERQIQMRAWEDRYNSPEKLPVVALEAPNKQAAGDAEAKDVA
mmetsp:Transcript_449/g.1172  ORF Transcript_449/g.1172 Transcript_449/m.1172 type:complete len:790 (+) Transcript_449:93-2462(+)|eukprot:CAMPEP_0197418894 /NCGR_PEP_ID=MMETSP1170-20131217/4454_1 /TAXON_ID=54406 /ORGANISM="Sarcinochrysis sp, Strain CCMP770" /LENGTH=789 /DNA_ID=CAMNT_0042945967 /DNA_START=93 /DNA_END=2462 /DNA_ORIENTATION=+